MHGQTHIKIHSHVYCFARLATYAADFDSSYFLYGLTKYETLIQIALHLVSVETD